MRYPASVILKRDNREFLKNSQELIRNQEELIGVNMEFVGIHTKQQDIKENRKDKGSGGKALHSFVIIGKTHKISLIIIWGTIKLLKYGICFNLI